MDGGTSAANAPRRERSPQCCDDRVLGRRRHHEVTCVELGAHRPARRAPRAHSRSRGRPKCEAGLVDAQGGALPGVTVTVRNQDTGMFRETVSDADGTYFVGGVVPGDLRDHRRVAGLQEVGRKDIRLEDRQDHDDRHRARRRRARGGRGRHRPSRPLVDVTSKEVGGNITGARARRAAVGQPQLHRLRRAAARHRPDHQHRVVRQRLDHASTGRTRATTTTCSTAANNNDDVIGQRAGTQARTPIESVQEFQVITNQFDAEFGRTAGAIINAVTKQRHERVSRQRLRLRAGRRA